ncbi:hypothetical protein [Amycolatopsis japonica]
MTSPRPVPPSELAKTRLSLVQNKPTRAQKEPSPASLRAEDAETAKEFCALLDELRKWVGISFKTMQDLTGKKLSKSRAHQIVHADRLPSSEDLALFLEACNVSPEETNRWGRGANRILNGPPRESVFEEPPPRQAPMPTPGPASPKPLPSSTRPEWARESASAPSQPLAGAGAVPPAEVSVPAWAPQAHPQFVTPFPATAKVPMSVTMRALMVFTMVVVLLTGSVATLWVLRVPTELIITMLGVISVSVSGWLLSLRWRWQLLEQQKRGRFSPSYLKAGDPDEVFGGDLKAAPPVIGL